MESHATKKITKNILVIFYYFIKNTFNKKNNFVSLVDDLIEFNSQTK